MFMNSLVSTLRIATTLIISSILGSFLRNTFLMRISEETILYAWK